MAGPDRLEFERELLARKLPIIHYTALDYRQDLDTIAHLAEKSRAEQRSPAGFARATDSSRAGDDLTR